MLSTCKTIGVTEAGCDEAGRGCLAGPVYAAAVILPDGYGSEMLNDSKQLTERQRYRLREEIERTATAWGIGTATAAEIDEINILNASILAKTYRDDFMKSIASQYPVYGWEINKGYPTRKHREAIEKYGITPYHRKSFRLTEHQLTLF